MKRRLKIVAEAIQHFAAEIEEEIDLSEYTPEEQSVLLAAKGVREKLKRLRDLGDIRGTFPPLEDRQALVKAARISEKYRKDHLESREVNERHDERI